MSSKSDELGPSPSGDGPQPAPPARSESEWRDDLRELGASAPATLSDEWALTREVLANATRAWILSIVHAVPSLARAAVDAVSGKLFNAIIRLGLVAMRVFLTKRTTPDAPAEDGEAKGAPPRTPEDIKLDTSPRHQDPTQP